MWSVGEPQPRCVVTVVSSTLQRMQYRRAACVYRARPPATRRAACTRVVLVFDICVDVCDSWTSCVAHLPLLSEFSAAFYSSFVSVHVRSFLIAHLLLRRWKNRVACRLSTLQTPAVENARVEAIGLRPCEKKPTRGTFSGFRSFFYASFFKRPPGKTCRLVFPCETAEHPRRTSNATWRRESNWRNEAGNPKR